MVISKQAKKYLKVLGRAKIQGQLMREFIIKDLWSASMDAIQDELNAIDRQRKLLEMVKKNIKRRDKND